MARLLWQPAGSRWIDGMSLHPVWWDAATAARNPTACIDNLNFKHPAFSERLTVVLVGGRVTYVGRTLNGGASIHYVESLRPAFGK